MKLACGPWEMVVAPEGAAILSLRRNGRDILRLTPQGASDPFDHACFPLVPYANRIAFGTLEWEGRLHHLPRNHPGQTHPLHGTGWRERWDIVESDAKSVTMQRERPADRHWPWSFTAVQRLELDAEGLNAWLEIRNDDRGAMPVSLGFHPYFSRDGATALQFEAGHVWLADDQMLPTKTAPADHFGDWSAALPLEQPQLIDHCYADWNGSAIVTRDDGDIRLAGSGTPALHIFLPPGEAFFCAEPVTAMPDAVNHDEAAVLAPGKTMQAGMRITSA
ncbi:aldose 1-epimerase [Stakelama tenebrarum]|uniref:Aldose 1-epimerase n=1 Tax=Stakelama tenebrarum TaxID=2711215 RepID=A0A6G6Y5K2_9SPHN|nr:aldose 1-epimerase [Sphingosinithalassobacter tenebrarum]QIG80212.1 aldose 1-epimerase [Sphingosinithalassobacter tenebrarum]